MNITCLNFVLFIAFASPANAWAGAPDTPVVEYTLKPSTAADEALIFTPPGFDKPGVPAQVAGADAAHLTLVVKDAPTGKPTPCRVNVIGPDGNYYEPKDNPLKPYSMTGQFPKGWGNRPEKAPIRYFGRFFYCAGEADVAVPAGPVRIEVWKGLEYRPVSMVVTLEKGAAQRVEMILRPEAPMAALSYYSGDAHLHFPRESDADDRRIFDLLDAEGVRYGTTLAYNEPAGPYTGAMDKLASPQRRGLGKASIRSRGDTQLISGQEYRNATYGHMNLFLLDELVRKGESLNANNWPLYGDIARRARSAGGVSFYAHGGYAQEIYADVVQDNIDAVELLQFGVYRGIGLSDWYRMLNCGFRIPTVGACDFPACRKLADCITYVHADQAPGVEGWLRGATAGRSFVTTGPLLLLEVDGQKPGDRIAKSGPGPHRVRARVRVRSEVTPVTNVQVVVNGRVLAEKVVSATEGQGEWVELSQPVALDRSGWIAARAFSLSRLGTPDAESHTNPVFVDVDGKAPYERASLDVWVQRLDAQIAVHKARTFPEKARVIAYYEKSRDILLKIREAGGASSTGHPSDVLQDGARLDDLGRRTHTEEELRAFLKPVPPKPIEEALRTFETVRGFRMELVAHEPLVNSPVAAAFDEDGNLYVAEMRDYPYKPLPGKEPLGSVRLLVDKDGDGRFDEGHVFADRLLWAAGIAPWKGGVFVAAPPDIWYLKDTDGDRRADVRRKVFTGFGTKNQQAMLNNLQWGLDHKIYGSTAGNGGSVRHADRPDAEPIAVDGRDFRFDPRTETFEAITGTVQFGNTFDDWGNRFVCSESQPLLHVVLPQHYLVRNPYLAVPRTIENLAVPPVPIFRISPIERWRQIRSSRRIAHNARAATAAGASHHVVDAAAGVTIYRGGAYPPEYYGNVFVGDAQNNLVHRRRLAPSGVTFTSSRADEGTEFVRSPDVWFRPVNFVNAPDGTLYVLDMCREILESIHIPNDVVKYLDLTSGRDRGRIYRIAPAGFQYPGPPRLARATTTELVAALESPHGWWRDTAHRLLLERQDAAAVGPLRRLLRDSSRPESRIHALWSLEGLGALTSDDLQHALDDRSPHVLGHALQLAETRRDDRRLWDKVLALDSNDATVRFQLAFTLGEAPEERAVPALAQIARTSAADPWIRTAILSSSRKLADVLFNELVGDRAFAARPEGGEFLVSLASVVGSRKRPEEVARVLEAIDAASREAVPFALRDRLVLAIGAALQTSGGRLDTLAAGPGAALRLVQSVAEESRRTAANASAPVVARQAAIRLLACFSFAKSGAVLEGLLDPRQPEPVQVAVLQALAGYADSDVAGIVMNGWKEYTPAVRTQAIETLLSRTDGTRAFLQAVARGQASAAQLDPVRRSQLVDHRDEAIRNEARRLLTAVNASRQQVLTDYQSSLELAGDAGRGQAVFRRECAACHKIGDFGRAVGPDLTSSAARDSDTLLIHILDPNRNVLPNYVQYQVADRDGRIYNGLLSAQSDTTITLQRDEGKSDTILRTNVDQIVATGKSLMPEGLETKVNKPEMADLIAFLRSSQAQTPASEQPLDVGTEPGLIEPVNRKD
ncbi:MAG: CehA/McbA family metallohydrolase [Isosphaeraceae bacterium]|nr:CehA/McbA family metallohydrolase [Isosphaeraceae bacterium]